MVQSDKICASNYFTKLRIFSSFSYTVDELTLIARLSELIQYSFVLYVKQIHKDIGFNLFHTGRT